jgi:HAD superfamily hydrolase (TIGR01548 family)
MSELFIKQEVLKTLPQVDALILDIDGVVLDVQESFRRVISETTQYYLTHKLELEDTGVALPPEATEHFKMAGGFNSDWDLTNAAVALLVAKHAVSGAKDTQSLADQEPDWVEYTRDIKRRGGGPVAAESVILDRLNPNQRRDFSINWNSKLVVQLCQEMYGGLDACKKLYGFDPQYIQQDGYYKKEKVLLDPSLLPTKLQIGVLTGRSHSETELAMKFAGLTQLIPQSNWVTESDGVRKPDGQTLILCQEKMKFKHAIFFGDTMDDLNTVFNYRETKGSGRAKVAAATVLSAPPGASNRRVFLEAGTEIATPDINTFLQYLNHVIK